MTEKILGIDPGSHHMGIGCIEKRGSALKILFADTLSVPKNLPVFQRLEKIAERLRPLVDKLKPTAVAIEDIFYGQNARSAFQIGMARGVALSCCFGVTSEFFEYAPTTVKQVVTGYGKADKNQVAKMVQMILGLTGALADARHDTTDALAVAICHAISSQKLQLEKAFNARISQR